MLSYADLPPEEMMKKLFSTIIATVAIVAPAHAQQQTSVKVDGKDYTVTEFPGRSMHMVQLSGPEGSAMVSVQNDKISAYISPPGGGGQQDLINKVWNAYQDQKKGNAVANNNATPAGGTNSDDPNAALRAAQLARLESMKGTGFTPQTGQFTPGVTLPDGKVTFQDGAAAVVQVSSNREIRLSTDGANALVIDKSVSGKNRTMGADYAGDRDKNTPRVIGANAKDIFLVLDPHHIGRIGGNDTWEVIGPDGKLINKEGGLRLHQIRDYAESLGDSVIADVWTAEQAAKAEATKARASGKEVSFDPDATKRGQDAWAWMVKHAGEATAKTPKLP
jgi:hypothetical protein